MSFYQSKLKQVRANCYANDRQLEAVIGIRKYINDNYEKDLNLDLLSRNSFVSKYHLLRLFKKYYGQTPRQYLIDKRMEKAKEHLKNRMSVTETCFAVGFESVGSFSSLFKRRTAQTPSEYQKEQFSRSELSS